MVMAGMFEWHRNKQYIVISEFVITGVYRYSNQLEQYKADGLWQSNSHICALIGKQNLKLI